MQASGKFKIDTDICMAVVKGKPIFSCNGTIEIFEDGTVAVDSTDAFKPLLSGRDWKLMSTTNISDTLWKICLQRGDDRLDTMAEQIIPGSAFKFLIED